MKFEGTILKLFPVEEKEYNGDPTAKLDIILESKPNANEWKEKWYGNLSIFMLESDDTVQVQEPAPMEAPVEVAPEGTEEDLPF